MLLLLRWPWYFNPRSPCGERLVNEIMHNLEIYISIHAPRVGSDDIVREKHPPRNYFNPRSPCGERRSGDVISLLLESNFNPRSPCGERLPGQSKP